VERVLDESASSSLTELPLFFCPGKRQEGLGEMKAKGTFSRLDSSHVISGGNKTYFPRLLLIGVDFYLNWNGSYN